MPGHFFVIAGDFWYALVLLGTATRLLQPFLWSCTGTEQALAHLVNITGQSGLPRHIRPHGLQVSGEWVGTCRGMPGSLLAYIAWTSANVWTHTAPCSATLSAAPPSLASEVPAKQAGGSTVIDVPFSTEVYQDSATALRSTVVPYSCQGLVL